MGPRNKDGEIQAGPGATRPATSTLSAPTHLGTGRRVYIHAGKGTNGYPDYQHRYWDRAAYVWNNSGDTAYVRNPSGTLIDSCSWGVAAATPTAETPTPQVLS